ncbi:hypothetical protein PHYPO_G00160100 [Pangasianodon hypophthalmus]|uniref:Secreted protein n=1 Tax=Pangasianodon hypophthalmus TaxID=310915 RepID=A0A5N5JTS9_PANHP|nr:hypothetical protein PHYPO_G00160100 [Pangasianodon hypophthalmus]
MSRSPFCFIWCWQISFSIKSLFGAETSHLTLLQSHGKELPFLCVSDLGCVSEPTADTKSNRLQLRGQVKRANMEDRWMREAEWFCSGQGDNVLVCSVCGIVPSLLEKE